MATSSAPQALPRWFVIWRWVVRLAIGLFVLGAMYALPFALAPWIWSRNYLSSYPTPTAKSPVEESIFILTYDVIGVGLLLGLLAFILGVLINLGLGMSRVKTLAVGWGRIARNLGLLVVIGILTLVLLVSTPTDAEFSPFEYVLHGLSGPCTYSFNIVAFVDRYGSGAEEVDDARLPNVTVVMTYPEQNDSSTKDRVRLPTGISTLTTDQSGLASQHLVYQDCPSSATQYGAGVSIKVQVPSGYTPTTATTFGPYSLEWNPQRSNEGLRTVHVGFKPQS